MDGNAVIRRIQQLDSGDDTVIARVELPDGTSLRTDQIVIGISGKNICIFVDLSKGDMQELDPMRNI